MDPGVEPSCEGVLVAHPGTRDFYCRVSTGELPCAIHHWLVPSFKAGGKKAPFVQSEAGSDGM